MLLAKRDATAPVEHSVKVSAQPQRHIYIIDDNVEIRSSLHFVLAAVGIASWPFASVEDFLEDIPDLQPAPILVDVRMPNINGLEMMQILLDRGIRWPILAMMAQANIPIAVRAIKLGAMEFLEKPFETDVLFASIQSAFAELVKMKEVEDIKRRARQLIDTLTPREFEVICALISGVSNKAAAFSLSLSVRTIEMHRANALLKLRVRNIAEAVWLARDAGVHVAAHAECRLVNGRDFKFSAHSTKFNDPSLYMQNWG